MCADLCMDMCMNICVDMCMDTCEDMCIDMCVDMCMDMCTDMCMDMRMDMCTDMSVRRASSRSSLPIARPSGRSSASTGAARRDRSSIDLERRSIFGNLFGGTPRGSSRSAQGSHREPDSRPTPVLFGRLHNHSPSACPRSFFFTQKNALGQELTDDRDEDAAQQVGDPIDVHVPVHSPLQTLNPKP